MNSTNQTTWDYHPVELSLEAGNILLDQFMNFNPLKPFEHQYEHEKSDDPAEFSQGIFYKNGGVFKLNKTINLRSVARNC